MKAIEDMGFYTEIKRGRHIGRVREFNDLRSRPCKHRLDALDEIIDLTRDRIADITESQQRAAGQ